MGSRPTFRVPLRVVFYREGEDWMAHCLEFDLIGDGPTRDDALEVLSQVIALQVHASLEHNNPANLFSAADGKVFRMFAEGTDVADAILEVGLLDQFRSDPFIIEGLEAREYEDSGAELATT